MKLYITHYTYNRYGTVAELDGVSVSIIHESWVRFPVVLLHFVYLTSTNSCQRL